MAQDDSVVSAQWLHQHLGQPNIKVLDASWYMPTENRDPWQEYQVAHIPGALFFDIDGIVDRTTDLPHMLPSEEAFAAAVSALGIKKQDKVIVYDRKGFFSAPRVWWMFRVFEHNEVWVLDGGLPQWRASGFELGYNCPDDTVLKSKAANSAVETVYNGESANAITFHAEFQPKLFWTLEKVKHNVDAQPHQIVDARSKARFDGIAPEPRKGVRSGHIPGTKCVPFPEMFDNAPMLLSTDELFKKFEQAGISLDQPIVVTCGSGVTACIVALVWNLALLFLDGAIDSTKQSLILYRVSIELGSVMFQCTMDLGQNGKRSQILNIQKLLPLVHKSAMLKTSSDESSCCILRHSIQVVSTRIFLRQAPHLIKMKIVRGRDAIIL